MIKAFSKRTITTNFISLHSLMLIFCLFQATDIFAQDKIITNDDRIIVGYNLEIGKNAIFYNVEESTNSELKRIEIADVVIIKRNDGTIVEPGKVQPDASVQQETKTMAPEITLSEKAKESNKEYIEQINSSYIYKDDVEYKKDKKTNFGVLQFGVSENSIIYTDELFLSFKYGLVNIERHLTPSIAVFAHNISYEVIYIDLGNTFFNSECIYVPTATQVTNSSTGGVGVNLGGVAGALGVGGTLGTLASGVNVGGSSGSSTTEITYAQRIIAIPPHGSIELFTKIFYSHDVMSSVNSWSTVFYCMKYEHPKGFPGESQDISDGKNMIFTKIHVTYSKTEDLSGGTAKLFAELYPTRVYYMPKKNFEEVFTPLQINNLWEYVKFTEK